MSLAHKLDEMEALIASIRMDLGIKKELRLKAPEYQMKEPKPEPKELKKVDVKKMFIKERFTEENFFDKLHALSTMKKFTDGSEKRVVTTLDRQLWPLTKDGKMYDKLQDLCYDFDLEVVRDGGPNVYIIMKEEKKEGGAAGGAPAGGD
jgi:hypothetical protein